MKRTDKPHATMKAKKNYSEPMQYAAFLILLIMAATETEYISFYVVCLLVSGILILISNTKKTER